jgi:hypothetical protein
MSQSTADSETGASHQAAAIARWDDEGGASKCSPAKASDKSPGTLASWLVPPIVVPGFFTALIIISGIYQHVQ